MEKTLKDRLLKPLYQLSTDGDSWHTYIKYENMPKILEEQEKEANVYFGELLNGMSVLELLLRARKKLEDNNNKKDFFSLGYIDEAIKWQQSKTNEK